ncbi:MAG: InlB B-repeat-containing protein [Steroidobacteraceae bacterium]
MSGAAIMFSVTDWRERKRRVGSLITSTLLACLLTGCGGAGSTSAPPGTPLTDVTLTVAVNGIGNVTSSPAGIDCSGTCTAPFVQSSTVTLTVAPGSGEVFGGWGGPCADAGITTTCAVPMSQNQSVTATFSAQPPPTAKPTLIGLVTMGSQTFLTNGTLPQNRLLEANAHPGVYVAAVIEVTWSQLEPQPGVFDDSAIDAALQNIATYNAQYPATPLVGKLRVFAGPNVPAWVLQQVGMVTLTDSNGSSAVFPDFWTPAYSALWTQLQQHLASVYDTNPLIGEVAISVCSSITAEPFVVPGDAASQQALTSAGYTGAQMQACLMNAPGDYAAWQRTPLDYTFNPTSFAGAGSGSAFAIQVMQQFRQALGTRAVLANHDLDDPILSTEAQDYAEFQALEAQARAASPPMLSPLEFQTAGQSVDWPTVIPFAISTYRPTEIEIWNSTAVPGGLAPITLTELQQWSAQIKATN